MTGIQKGDLLFVDAKCGPLCDAINAVTPSKDNIPMSHMGIVNIEGADTLVFEAISMGVVATPWAVFQSKHDTIYYGRIKEASAGFIDSALTFCKQQLGKPYDIYFLMDNDRYYCSELIYDATQYANGNKPYFELQPMTYKNPESDSINTDWQGYFDTLKVAVPEGQPGCNPGGISLSEKITFGYLNRL